MTSRDRGGPPPAAHAVAGWGAAYAAFNIARLVAIALRHAAGLDAVHWLQTIAGLGVGLAAVAVAAPLGPRSGRGGWPWLLLGGALLSSWGLLQDLLMLASAQPPEDLWGPGGHLLAAAGAVLLARLAVKRSPPSPPPWLAAGPSERAARIAAWSGTAAFAPYAWMKTVWATGGSFAGRTGEEVARISAENGASDVWMTLQRWGVDPTVLFAAAGVLLLWALVLPWGRRLPRWLLLAPAAVGAVTLLPYGLIGVGYAVLATAGALPIRAGDFPTPGDALAVAWIGLTAFAVFGAALSVAAWSFWARTGPVRRTGAPEGRPRDTLERRRS